AGGLARLSHAQERNLAVRPVPRLGSRRLDGAGGARPARPCRRAIAGALPGDRDPDPCRSRRADRPRDFAFVRHYGARDMTSLPFFQVDAFASAPLTGNPAAVMPLDKWLDDATMQAIAAENNL